MGHKIGKEMIDPGVKDHIMSFVGNVADLETEINTDIISAVNSLIADRVDNVENIGKLAEAIGEPVTASDTIDEVVDGLGEMLSTFKTNMMNSGVMVESSDKFKALIDKIKGLTEGEGNKGIQFAQGNGTQISVDTMMDEGIPVNIDFEPMYLFLAISNRNTPSYTSSGYHGGVGTLGVVAICIPDLIETASSCTIGLGAKSSSYQYDIVFNTGLTDGKITVKEENVGTSWIYGYPAVDYDWYAIGIGEEDTTLRDSLASILEGKGVEVTEEDDMASLIGKVDSDINMPRFESGEEYLIADIDNLKEFTQTIPSYGSYYSNEYKYTYNHVTVPGTIKFTTYVNYYRSPTYVTVEHKRNDEILSTTTFEELSSDNGNQTKDYDVEIDDVIIVTVVIGEAASDEVSNTKLTANIIW